MEYLRSNSLRIFIWPMLEGMRRSILLAQPSRCSFLSFDMVTGSCRKLLLLRSSFVSDLQRPKLSWMLSMRLFSMCSTAKEGSLSKPSPTSTSILPDKSSSLQWRRISMKCLKSMHVSMRAPAGQLPKGMPVPDTGQPGKNDRIHIDELVSAQIYNFQSLPVG